MTNCDPSALARASRCFCSDEATQRAQVLYLLCQIFQRGMGVCGEQEGAGPPGGVATPDYIGQLYHDTVADAYYRSTGLTAADWVAIAGAPSTAWTSNSTTTVALISFGFADDSAVTSISFPNLATSVSTAYLSGLHACTSISFPVLTQIGGDGLEITDCPLLTSITFPSLVTIMGWVFINYDIGFNTNLAIFSAPSLTTIAGDTHFDNNPALASWSAPLWVPTNGTFIMFTGCSLNATSVELILRRCVLAGVTTCVIDVSGGTNAGIASLSVQGQTDAATLGTQLTINP